MAILLKGILSPPKGSIGKVTCYRRKGVDIIQSKKVPGNTSNLFPVWLFKTYEEYLLDLWNLLTVGYQNSFALYNNPPETNYETYLRLNRSFAKRSITMNTAWAIDFLTSGYGNQVITPLVLDADRIVLQIEQSVNDIGNVPTQYRIYSSTTAPLSSFVTLATINGIAGTKIWDSGIISPVYLTDDRWITINPRAGALSVNFIVTNIARLRQYL
jgi:hypothetical protein